MQRGIATDILLFDDGRWEDVEIPEIERVFRVRRLGAGDRIWFLNNLFVKGADGEQHQSPLAQAQLLVKTVVNEDNSRVFDEADIETLAACSPSIVDRLSQVAIRLSGLRPGAQDEARKNSNAAPSSDSSSDSRSASDAPSASSGNG